MVWNTHDRDTDHHGTDKDTHVVLDGATTSYADGSGLHAAISDLDTRVGSGMLHQSASAPSSPVEGQSYYDTTLHKSRTWDGSTWQNWW